jgi:transcriptional regulator with XRE-family HTH domain
MTLGRQIRKARIDKGWKQQDLQQATGLSQTYLSQIERDKVDPRISIVKRIAAALGVSIDQLVETSESEPLPVPA